MIIFFRASRQAARDFSNKVKANGTNAKLHDAKEKGEYSVNGTRFGVDLASKSVELIKKVG